METVKRYCMLLTCSNNKETISREGYRAKKLKVSLDWLIADVNKFSVNLVAVK